MTAVCLESWAHQAFPRERMQLVVVDPGVGARRAARLRALHRQSRSFEGSIVVHHATTARNIPRNAHAAGQRQGPSTNA